ncbi:peptide chain release factor N(5)-glutamine methyltransferase [Borreliella carolinensis]|uniref:peptide chain release factor N(5)-glutamine methyltransferase n=1 Tax=Borreliella carolinensis TaxID=478174 RepID=A0ABY9E4L1_9SPIR|nr:peptide chain release factor N(5)-glutamine methyltransferase [Borreliella carolinensis]WKC90595.1 peptide chain release factor N(5)-glutamine methyltransferase [Borreliella carolinensis]WNY67528.1 peptide chain release factor N(5)-glutamine methyltransferase [Borreliella carolinensis]
MNINEVINYAKSKNLDTIETLLILELILKTRKELIIANIKKSLTKKEQKLFFDQIDKIKKGTPIHYILQKKEFMGIEFDLNKHVLIPRFDTECLVEEALIQIQQNRFKKILDLCCGSGCIGLSIAYYMREKVILSDISTKALQIVAKNTKKLKLEKFVEIIHSNLLKCIKGKLDIIITNPPYLNKEELEIKNKIIKEPTKALLGSGKDGLNISRKILSQAKEKLSTNGLIIIESAPWQIKSLKDFAIKKGFSHLKTIYDLEKRARALILGQRDDTSIRDCTLNKDK